MIGTFGALLAMFVVCPALAFVDSARAEKRYARLRRQYRWRV